MVVQNLFDALSVFRMDDCPLSAAATSGRGPRNLSGGVNASSIEKVRLRTINPLPTRRPEPIGYPADSNTIANTTIHPTMTKETAAPAVILSFSLVV
jgi:hypothetical protein